MYIKDDVQYSFVKGWFLTPQLDMEHKLIKITEAINGSFVFRLGKFI